MADSITVEDVKAMKVADLRTALKARDLSTNGLKAELAQRLTDAVTGSASTAAAGDDPSGQTSGEATEVANDAVNSTEDLPSELPATAPANGTDSVADAEGKEDTLESIAAPVETSGTASEVVKPTDVNTVDPVPGVVQETKAPEQTMPLADEGEAGTKRKRDDDSSAMPVLPVNDASANVVEPVAVQEEKAAEPNDSVPAAPADEEQPEYKKPKLDAEASETGTDAAGAAGSNGAAADDIPVPSAGGTEAHPAGGDVLQLVDTTDAGSAAPAANNQSTSVNP